MIKYTGHASDQMIERGISVNEVEEAIKKGAKEIQLPDKILHHFRYFTVVTKKLNGNQLVITVKSRW